MPVELYAKPPFGRRLRRVSSTAGLRQICCNLWTSIPGLGKAAATGAPGAATGIPATGVGVTAPKNLPITGDAAGTQKTTIVFDSQNKTLAAAGTLTITYNIGAADVVLTVATKVGDDGNKIAVAAQKLLDAVTEFTATVAAGTVTVTPGDQTALSKLVATVT